MSEPVVDGVDGVWPGLIYACAQNATQEVLARVNPHVFKWVSEQNGRGSGTATFVFPTSNESVTVQMYSFRNAHALQCAIQREIAKAHHDGRVSMLNEIARMVP